MTHRITRHRLVARTLLSLAGWTLAALPAFGQLPTAQLLSVFPAGGRQGAPVEVEIAGADLEGVDRLDFSHPGIKAEPKRAAPILAGLPGEAVPNRFVVSVAADVPPGLYDVRAVGRFGISNPRTFAVGRLAELNEEATNTSFDKAMTIALESIVNGRTGAGAIDYFRFAARKGQRVLLELWAERLDSRLDGTLSLVDAAGRELGHSRDAIDRDPLMDVEIPADGQYTIAVYDMTYQGGSDFFYRLAVHTGPHVDFVFPPCGAPASKAPATVFGRNLPGGSASATGFDGRPLAQLPITIDYPGGPHVVQLDFAGYLPSRSVWLDGFSFRWPADGANNYLLTYASAPVVLEHEPNDKPEAAQRLTVPCELAGWFAGVDDADWLQFEARSGQAFWFQLNCQHRGQPSDPYLLVQRVTRDAQGKEQVTDVGEVDDEPSSNTLPGFPVSSADPVYRFAAPADGTYRVLVRDLASSTSPRPYTLAIREPQPDFRLVAVPIYPSTAKAKTVKPWSLLVRRGGTVMLDVVAFRRDGFNGDIEVSAAGLPKGITARPVIIPSGQTAANLVFESAADQPTWAGTIEVLGTALLGQEKVTRKARSGTAIWSPPASQRKPTPLVSGRLAHTIALAATADESLPVKIELGGRDAIEVALGGKLQVPIKITRSGYNDALTLTIEGLPGKLKAKPLTIAAGKNEGQLVIDVPAGTVLGEYSLVLHGEAKINYRRDEGGLRAANEYKARLDKLTSDPKALTAAKAAADKRVAAAMAAAKPKPETVVLYSPPARLKITAAPVKTPAKTPPAASAPGQKPGAK